MKITLEPVEIKIERDKWGEGFLCTVVYEIILETEDVPEPQFLGSNTVTIPSEELKSLSTVFAELKNSLNKVIMPKNSDTENFDNEDPL